MKPISLGPIFTFTRSFFTTSNLKFISNSNFLAFSTQAHQGSYNHNPRRNDEESRAAVLVSLWWDFESCRIPVNTSGFRVAPAIVNAVRALGIRGPIRITAFGDLEQISMTNQKALSYTGVHFSSASSGISDLYSLCIFDPPPPAHIFLISGNEYYSSILHRLRSIGYNILVASPDTDEVTHRLMCSASTIMWQWNSMVEGEILSGTFCNLTPVPSWYDDDIEIASLVVEKNVDDPEHSATRLLYPVGEKNEEQLLVPYAVSTNRFDIFAEESIDSYEGSAQSMTRDPLVQYILEQGPPFLKSLTESDLLHLVDFLVKFSRGKDLRRFQTEETTRSENVSKTSPTHNF